MYYSYLGSDLLVQASKITTTHIIDFTMMQISY